LSDQLGKVCDEGINVNWPRLARLPPGESKEALGQGSSAPRTASRYLDTLAKLRQVRRNKGTIGPIKTAENDHQKIIEVMCNAASEMAYSFHLLGLP
jgi:hypothetical protein